eukprot:CAMPEP_0114518238 /NCGR_PEP_ID=MMETSP0109-20121206/18331_1 /TAXON_ID=29199 /ORGANISM="Chlorarachnion reptans, Strain CCCM449" /LENGTH=379 /DNA_ID=CAMNT_0001698833 /DNA_START=213 /DNA_END=1352 /DNA_ORIENTATION=+
MVQMVKKSLNPEFEEQFEVPCVDLESIRFQVKDHDVIGKNEELGHVTIYQKKEKLSRWPVTKDLKLRQGSLRVTLSLSSKKDWVLKPYAGILKVKIMEAAQLHDTNMLTHQNPFVSVKYLDDEQKTDVCLKGGVTPKWNQTLEFKVEHAVGPLEAQWVHITVKDKELLKEDYIGQVTLPLQLLLTNKKKWWKLFWNQSKNETRGEILLEASFTGEGGYPPRTDETNGIIKATYGVQKEREVDVTTVLRAKVKDGKLKLKANMDLDFVFGCDPYPGAPKELNIKYMKDGKETKVSIPVAERKGEIANAPRTIQHVLAGDHTLKDLQGGFFGSSVSSSAIKNVLSSTKAKLNSSSADGELPQELIVVIIVIFLAISYKFFY